jgi:Fe-S oxidoreductase
MKLIYHGCINLKRLPNLCKAGSELIQILDPEYKELENPPCCGSLLFHSDEEGAKKNCNEVYNWLKSNNVTELTTICAGCYNYFVTFYPQYIPGFNIKIYHISQFLNKPENLGKINLEYPGDKKVKITYHDPCHLKNSRIPIFDEPREFLSKIKNIDLVPLEWERELSTCCGAGAGVYSSFKEVSDFTTADIFRQVKKSRAKILITPCSFCYVSFKRLQLEKKPRFEIFKFEDFINKIRKGEVIG